MRRFLPCMVRNDVRSYPFRGFLFLQSFFREPAFFARLRKTMERDGDGSQVHLMSCQLVRGSTVCRGRRKTRDWDNIPQASMKRARRVDAHLATAGGFQSTDHDVRTRARTKRAQPLPQLHALISTVDRAPNVTTSAGTLSQATTPLCSRHRQRGPSSVDGRRERAEAKHIAQAHCPQDKATPETSRHVCMVRREYRAEDEQCSKSGLHFAILATGA